MNNDSKLNIVDLIKKIDELKSEIDKFHPLPKEVEDRIFQKYRLDWNYNSNAIEGNSLNYGETYAFLMHGITAHGKPLKDYLDIKGHNEAINYLINLVRNKEELTEAIIRELHKVILVESYETDAVTQNGKLTQKTITLGAYKTVPNHVKTATGETHYFATPEEAPAKMNDLMTWYRKKRNDKEIHPVVLAAIFHHRFAEIHPFDDGNGRMARLLMNLILMQNNFPPAIIKIRDRNNYYLALSQADSGDTKNFVEYVAEVLIHSMEIYLKGGRGESIEEEDDIDKEILIFKKEFEGRKDLFKEKKNDGAIERVFTKSFHTLITELNKSLIEIKSFFLNTSEHWQHPNKNQNTLLSIFSILLEDRTYFHQIISAFGKDYLSFCFNFVEFKDAKKPFSVFLTVALILQEYDYQVSYCIDTKIKFPEVPLAGIDSTKPVFIQKYYHQVMNDNEIKKAVIQIKKDLFKYIKEKSK